MRISESDLTRACNAILCGFGCQAGEAAIVADHLVMANLSGHDSHGVGMLPTYAEMIRSGTLVPNQEPRIVSAAGAIRIVDGCGGFGQRMALIALNDAIAAAERESACVLALRNSGHVGRVGAFSEYCADRGVVSLHFVSVCGVGAIVAPHQGREPRFATNPVSIGFPGSDDAFPFLDMATSTIAFGKARVAHNRSEPTPADAIIDGQGRDTRDASPLVAHREGALKAFGAHKGSGLAIFTELLAGAVAGTQMDSVDRTLRNGPRNNMLSILIDPAAFGAVDEMMARATAFGDYVKGSAPAEGFSEVLLPGDPERRARAVRRRDGIEVEDPTVAELMAVAEEFGVDDTQLRGLA